MGGSCSANGGHELPKRILWTNPGIQRRRGRPKSRWIDGVEEDARHLGCRNWRAGVPRIEVADDICLSPRPTQGCTADGDDDAHNRRCLPAVDFTTFREIDELPPSCTVRSCHSIYT